MLLTAFIAHEWAVGSVSDGDMFDPSNIRKQVGLWYYCNKTLDPSWLVDPIVDPMENNQPKVNLLRVYPLPPNKLSGSVGYADTTEPPEPIKMPPKRCQNIHMLGTGKVVIRFLNL